MLKEIAIEMEANAYFKPRQFASIRQLEVIVLYASAFLPSDDFILTRLFQSLAAIFPNVRQLRFSLNDDDDGHFKKVTEECKRLYFDEKVEMNINKISSVDEMMAKFPKDSAMVATKRFGTRVKYDRACKKQRQQ